MIGSSPGPTLNEAVARDAKPVTFDTSRLVAADSLSMLRMRFREALEASFAPLEVVADTEPLAAPRLAEGGAWLEVPSPTGGGSLRCRLRDHGRRRYAHDDVVRARELMLVALAVRRALTAREDGRLAERRRIRRDLHDDLGASIIRICHEAPNERVAELARAAMRGLRDVLAALHHEPAPCQGVLDELEAELRARATASGRELGWSIDAATNHVLSAHARANLTRVLRESLTNALKHGTGAIDYAFTIDERELRATISNAVATPPEAGHVEDGFGLGNIVSRMAELGGTASYERHRDHFTLTIQLPWTEEA